MNFGLLRRRQWHIRPQGPGILPVMLQPPSMAPGVLSSRCCIS